MPSRACVRHSCLQLRSFCGCMQLSFQAEELKRAYHEQLREYHPDKRPNSKEGRGKKITASLSPCCKKQGTCFGHKDLPLKPGIKHGRYFKMSSGENSMIVYGRAGWRSQFLPQMSAAALETSSTERHAFLLKSTVMPMKMV